MSLAVFSGEVIIAVMVNEELYLIEASTTTRKWEAKEPEVSDEELKEYVEAPISRNESELFGNKFVRATFESSQESDRLRLNKVKFGLFLDGKFYLKKIRIGEVGLIHREESDDLAKLLQIEYDEGIAAGFYFPARIIAEDHFFRPLGSFLLKRINLLLCDLGDPNEILGRTELDPIMTETYAICTNRGAIGLIDDKGKYRFRLPYTWPFKSQDFVRGACRSCSYNLVCEEEIPFGELDQDLLAKFSRERISVSDISCLHFYMSPVGSAGWLVFDYVEKMVKFPRFFLKRVKIMSASFGTVRFQLGGLEVLMHLDDRVPGIVRHFFEKWTPPIDEEVRLWREKYPVSFDECWGLFGCSMVVFLESANYESFLFDEEEGCWVSYSDGNMVVEEGVASIYLYDRRILMDKFLEITVLPKDLCDLIVDMTYDWFPENFCDGEGEGLNEYDRIEFGGKIPLAKKMLE
jgi:hypothetical protein